MNCPNCKAKNIELFHDYGTSASGGPHGEYTRTKYYTYHCKNCNKEIAVTESIDVRVSDWADTPHTWA